MKTTVKSQTYYKFPSYHGLRIDFLKQSKVDVYNFFAKKHIIPFTSMEWPFVLMVGTMLQGIHY